VAIHKEPTIPILAYKSTLEKVEGVARLNPFPLPVSGTFNSLSRVLCNFPSQYLFAIGLWTVFSLKRNSPPVFVLYSQTARLIELLPSGKTIP